MRLMLIAEFHIFRLGLITYIKYILNKLCLLYYSYERLDIEGQSGGEARAIEV